MIHLFLGLPFGSPELSVYARDPASFRSMGEETGAFAGWLTGDVALSRAGNSAFVFHGGLGMSSLSYAAEDWRWDGAAYTMEAELGGRWNWGKGVVRGSFDLGLGPHFRLGLPDWAADYLVVAGGAHAGIGMEFGTAAVRPCVNFTVAGTLSGAQVSGDVVLPDGELSWYWSAGGARALVQVGVAFDPPRRRAPPETSPAAPGT